MTIEKFISLSDAFAEVQRKERTERYRAALLSIAALSEGPVVHGGFDEPGSARVARDALATEWIGPCVHGRDPWERCDKCARAGQSVAWAMAEIARAGA